MTWMLALLLIVGLLVMSWFQMGEENCVFTHSDYWDPSPYGSKNLGELTVGHINKIGFKPAKHYKKGPDLSFFWGVPYLRMLVKSQVGKAGIVATFLVKKGSSKDRWCVAITHSWSYAQYMRSKEFLLPQSEDVVNDFIAHSLLHVLFCDRFNGAGKITLNVRDAVRLMRYLADSECTCRIYSSSKALTKEALEGNDKNQKLVQVYELSILNIEQLDDQRVRVLYSTTLSWRKQEDIINSQRFFVNSSMLLTKAVKPYSKCVPWESSRSLEYAMSLMLNQMLL